jgi:hypothetical protein
MTDQTLSDAKLNAIALTRAALTHDHAALYSILASIDLDEARETVGNLVSLNAALLTTITDHPLLILDCWARATVNNA